MGFGRTPAFQNNPAATINGNSLDQAGSATFDFDARNLGPGFSYDCVATFTQTVNLAFKTVPCDSTCEFDVKKR